MVETLKKVREPAAWLVIAGVALGLLMDLIRVFQGATGEEGGWAFSTYAQALFTPGTAALLLLVVGVCAAWQPRSRRASALAATAAVIAALGVVLQLVFGVLHLVRIAPLSGAVPTLVEAIDLVAFLLIPVAVTLLLVRLASRPASAAAPELEPAPAHDANGPAHDPHAPAWRPDQAAGAAWSTASGAATGAGASGWGVPGERSGWVPQGENRELPGGPPEQTTGRRPLAQPTQAGHDQNTQAGPQIIYPDSAADTTQFRGRWEPNRPE